MPYGAPGLLRLCAAAPSPPAAALPFVQSADAVRSRAAAGTRPALSERPGNPPRAGLRVAWRTMNPEPAPAVRPHPDWVNGRAGLLSRLPWLRIQGGAVRGRATLSG